VFPFQENGAFQLKLEELPRDESGLVSWVQVFGVARPLRVEIGVGVSAFLIELALRDPEFNYVGFEYSAKRVAKFLKKVETRSVNSIRVAHADATRWLERLFIPGSVDSFYVNHPDPWPKRRHGKKRLINRQNANLLARLLRPGGRLSLRTDFAAYAHHMLEILDETPNLRNVSGLGSFAQRPLDAIVTHYEGKFLKVGQPIYYLEYVRQVSPGPDSGQAT